MKMFKKVNHRRFSVRFPRIAPLFRLLGSAKVQLKIRKTKSSNENYAKIRQLRLQNVPCFAIFVTKRPFGGLNR